MVALYARLLPWLLAILELALMVAAGALVLLRSRREARPQFPEWFRRLARRPAAASLLIGFGVLTLRVALIPILGVPEPGQHDEFSYLLAADTFAHGRLTNATPPAWEHFESFHIIVRPTYQSMYALGQGLVLAAGQWLGHPWIGQLLITALLCGVMVWTLRGDLPPDWALAGAVLAALRLGILSYWMNEYWSASIVALGGALALGAWPRVRRGLRIRDAVLMAAGLVLLANTRPYEGLLYALPFAVAMAAWWTRSPRRGAVACRVALPIAAVLAIAAMGMGVYYRSVTGSPVRMTYEVNSETYGMAPYLLWNWWSSPAPAPTYHDATMQSYYERAWREYHEQGTIAGFAGFAWEKFEQSWRFYLGPLLTLPLIVFLFHATDRRTRFPLLLCGVQMLGLFSETWSLPHYSAPATAALYVLIVQGLRHMAQWKRGESWIGAAVVTKLFAIAAVMIALRVAAAAVHAPIEYRWPRGNLDRARIARKLESTPGQHLVIVQYGAMHNPDAEWVYNAADLVHARVVWARDLDGQNPDLASAFPDRQFWLVQADEANPQPVPISRP